MTLGDKFDYYFLEDESKDNPYKDNYLLTNSDDYSERIWLKIGDKVRDFAEESPIINGLRNKIQQLTRIYIKRDFIK